MRLQKGGIEPNYKKPIEKLDIKREMVYFGYKKGNKDRLPKHYDYHFSSFSCFL